MISKQRELELYELALIDYQKCIKEDGVTRFGITLNLETHLGMCNYFEKVHKVKIEQLRALYNKNVELRFSHNNGYWFPCGEAFPRIEALKLAIETVKKQIEDENRNH